jgi:transposase
MNRLVADHAGRELHVILDNLNTHKPKHDRWLARHKNVHFHFAPTHASWLNQVEVWFSILSSNALAGASFTSPRQMHEQIDAFIAAYNREANRLAEGRGLYISKIIAGKRRPRVGPCKGR